MPDKELTLMVFLLDRSGSMQSIKPDIVGGFAAMVEGQRAEPGRCNVSLYQFDTEFDAVYVDRPIADVPPLVLEPRGATALLDAMARTVATTKARIAELPGAERPGQVHFGIMTDGHENASVEFDRPGIRKLVNAVEKESGWIVSYLGSNQDAVEVGTGLGISADRSLTFTSETVDVAMSAYSQMTSRARQMGRRGESVDAVRTASVFSPDERRKSGK